LRISACRGFPAFRCVPSICGSKNLDFIFRPDSCPKKRFDNGTPFYQGKTEFSEKYLSNPVKWTTEETKIAIKDDILMSVRAPVQAGENGKSSSGLIEVRVQDGTIWLSQKLIAALFDCTVKM